MKQNGKGSMIVKTQGSESEHKLTRLLLSKLHLWLLGFAMLSLRGQGTFLGAGHAWLAASVRLYMSCQDEFLATRLVSKGVCYRLVSKGVCYRLVSNGVCYRLVSKGVCYRLVSKGVCYRLVSNGVC